MSSQEGIKAAMGGQDALFIMPAQANSQLLPLLFLKLLREYQDNPDRRIVTTVEV